LQRYGMRLTRKPDLEESLVSHRVPIAELTLAPRSVLEGRTLREIHFRERYGLQVLAIWRQGLVIQHEVADIPLRFGDAMLVQGPRDRLDLLRFDADFLLLEEAGDGRPGRKGALASAIVVISLGLAATGLVPMAVATLGGAALMVVTGCLTMDDAYHAVEWRTVFLVAGMLPLSIALDRTGTSALLGRGLVEAGGGYGALAASAVLLLITIALSILLGGQTVAVILAPVAIAAARTIGADPRAMAMVVALGCSLGFLSPLTHPASMLVMGPGGYTTRDYLRLGGPLTAVSIIVTLAGLHWIWGL
jgi:di/tricarboxylate transporter